jgi:hypothetical protein
MEAGQEVQDSSRRATLSLATHPQDITRQFLQTSSAATAKIKLLEQTKTPHHEVLWRE